MLPKEKPGIRSHDRAGLFVFPSTAKRRGTFMTGNISTEIAVVKADVGNLVVDDPVLTKYATEIRRLGRRVKEDVVEIGRYLDQAQKHAGHGTWLTWIEAEFGWSDQTAYHFIHLYQACQNPEFQNFWNSDLPMSALYRLAAPNTPQEARDEVAERIEAGEKLSCAEVQKTIKRAKGQISDAEPETSVASDGGHVETMKPPSLRDLWSKATPQERHDLFQVIGIDELVAVLPEHLRQGLEDRLVRLRGLQRSVKLTKLLRTALKSRSPATQITELVNHFNRTLTENNLDIEKVHVSVPK
jgi:hypothetical protein